MSRENVEIVHALNEAFNAGREDWPGYYHPDAEFHTPAEWPEERTLHGPEEIRKVADRWNENFDEYRWDEHELIDAGDAVVGLFHHRGRIKRSTEWVENEVGALFRVRSGKIAEVRAFLSWKETREAAGLSE